MTTATEVKPDNIESLEVERYWQDALRAFDEQYEEAEQSRQRWLRIGKGLLEKYRGHAKQEFWAWLDTTKLRSLTNGERQNSIWLALNAQVLMPALSESRIAHPSKIRQHVRENMRPIYQECRDLIAEPDTRVPHSPYPANETKSVAVTGVWEGAPPLAPLPRKAAPCFRWKRGIEVYNIFHKDARSAISNACKKAGKTGGQEIWDLILTAIDNGFLTANSGATRTPTLRILFPNSSRSWWEKYHLTDKKDREYVRDVIMPAAIANREAILKQPKAIDTIIAEHVKANQIAVQKQEAQKKVVELVKALPENQKQIIAYGKQMWPVVNATYDYDQVRAAVWTFQDLSRWFSQTLSGHNSPGSVAQIIRLSTKWMQEYLNRALPGEGGSRVRKIYVLIGELSRALENNPSGECRFPPPPHIEGQW